MRKKDAWNVQWKSSVFFQNVTFLYLIFIITLPLFVPQLIKQLWMKGTLLVNSPEWTIWLLGTPKHSPCSPTHVHIFVITVPCFVTQLIKHLWMKGTLIVKSPEWIIWLLCYSKRDTLYNSHYISENLNPHPNTFFMFSHTCTYLYHYCNSFRYTVY